ncbi:MAG: class I SAM-dependent methyltransferase [Chloroflexota bacterium]|nr:class I SAM-dependent methyltransferase [Chloroflexota bacterium]
MDHFHHDSLHTHQHMRWEYATALSALGPGGVLSSHDIVSPTSGRPVYSEFCRDHGLTHGLFRNVGIAVV